ncbi:hypothetical protein [Hymenobacter cellulosivorans]|uniref:DUF3828 domain-containing protein n=1 Tax=Hymenobacter cellulosivorans TaxID=2932249 RepID=A0ABY4F442_9BACT|nr:hypothetical protein [Hymenobacter cellulosivorans]UOQ50838.1 hypothetical protein MUN80_13830 [Hymenobacter cellulosivorans]
MSKILSLLVLTAVFSCNGPTQPPETAAPAATPPRAAAADTATGPVRTARRYVSWYAAHYKDLSNGFILNDDGQDSTKFYTVDFPDTEDWLRRVQSSGTVSAVYLAGWRTYFRRYDDTLRLHPQNDGPPAGFDYDFLMLSQEPDTKVADLQVGTFTMTRRQGSYAHVQARGPKHETWQEGLDFDLTQQADGRWLIDKVAVPDPAL